MKLPTYQDIAADPDQLAIYNLQLDGNYLITGPPGSGKTIMALWRAEQLQKHLERSQAERSQAERSQAERSQLVLAVYNKTLCRYVSNARAELKLKCNISTWHSWFSTLHWKVINKAYPPSAQNKWIPDWPKVTRSMTPELCQPHRVQHLIIDEAQDLHPDFFPLMYRFADNITIFADMNQQLDNNNAVLDDIRDCLDGFQERNLTRNYRNTKQIAAVADRFYVGLATGRCDPPTRSGATPRITACKNFNDAVERVVGYARTHSDQSIGIVVKWDDTRERYVNHLRHRLNGRDVQTYRAGMDADGLNFTGNQMTVVCMASVKGLEFDAVFLDLPYQNGNLNDVQKMQLYVATSRPREYLEFLHQGETPQWIWTNLEGIVRFTSEGPQDEEIF